MSSSIDIKDFPAFMDRILAATEAVQAQPVPEAWVAQAGGDSGEGFSSSVSQFGEMSPPLIHSRPNPHSPGTRPGTDRGDRLLSIINEADGNNEHVGDDSLHFGTLLADSLDRQAGTSRRPAPQVLNVNADQAVQAGELIAQQLFQTIGLG